MIILSTVFLSYTRFIVMLKVAIAIQCVNDTLYKLRTRTTTDFIIKGLL